MTRLLFALLFLLSLQLGAQEFSRQDSLRGSITPERNWWDLIYYDLSLEVFPDEKRIEGSNTIWYRVLDEKQYLQIDLQAPLEIREVRQEGKVLSFRKEGNAYFVKLEQPQLRTAVNKIVVTYGGQPREAVRAPWDGGFSWKKDRNGQHFIATSCQGLGASIWWPCKDHMYDEADSMRLHVEVPEYLADVSNGRLEGVDHNEEKKTKTYNWVVKNPINNYGVNLNIGDYVGWEETFKGEKGDLDLFYWALRQDETAARKQFEEVPRMLKAFEHWFGPYPFYEDGYKLVQVPYLGMEHQSSVTYGNEFQNGYLGRDLSRTGWGLKFDFIIIHESGHEWFANNITHRDIADMWIHESFTNYSESLFLEYHFGKEAGQEYVRGTRHNIVNRRPMIGKYGVNDENYDGDVYYKGGNVLNTLRTILSDDEKWRELLRSMNQHFYHQTISSAQLEAFIAQQLDLTLDSFFDQYLRDHRVPIFEYYIQNGYLVYRWTNCNYGFKMPVDIKIGAEAYRLKTTTGWQQLKGVEGKLSVDPNYYIGVMKSR